MEGCAEFDNCNGFTVNLDPEDIGVLPIPGQWDVPLTQVQQDLYCGFGGVNCVSCLACIDNESETNCRYTHGNN